MKYLICILSIICFLACGGDPVSSIDEDFFVGTWTGISNATYPGPDDGAITDEEPIKFVFTDSTFQYFQSDDTGFESNAWGSGNYVIGDSTLTFSDVVLRGYYPPMMDLQGEFIIGLVGSTLTLVQDANPNLFFQTYHLVTLDKEEI